MANMIEDVLVRVARGVSLTPHKRKPGAKLSDEEKDTLDRLADDYWAYAEMARELGCDSKTVSRYLKQRDKEREELEEELDTPSLFDVEEEV
jgi:DNA invertase Pin-like site-specific DNA recombinase